MAVIVAVVSMLMVSCKGKEDEVKKPDNEVKIPDNEVTKPDNEVKKADYEGTWVNTMTDDMLTATTTLELTSSTFVYSTVVGNLTTSKLSGTMTVAGDKMTQTLNSLTMPDMSKLDTTVIPDMSKLDSIVIPTTTIKKGDAGWDAAVNEIGGETNVVTYVVNGTKLTLKHDENNDGDFTDEGETMEFTKK